MVAMISQYVRLKSVRWLNRVVDPQNLTYGSLKDLAVKPLEEAGELMEAAKHAFMYGDVENVRMEAADVITAVCDLMAAFGITDLRRDIDDCFMRNERRGRVSKRNPKETKYVLIENGCKG